MAAVNSVRPFRASLKPAMRKSFADNPLYRARKRIRNPLLYPTELRARVVAGGDHGRRCGCIFPNRACGCHSSRMRQRHVPRGLSETDPPGCQETIQFQADAIANGIADKNTLACEKEARGLGAIGPTAVMRTRL
jgi:hypothetical protein